MRALYIYAQVEVRLTGQFRRGIKNLVLIEIDHENTLIDPARQNTFYVPIDSVEPLDAEATELLDAARVHMALVRNAR